jgi:hypothetical protein
MTETDRRISEKAPLMGRSKDKNQVGNFLAINWWSQFMSSYMYIENNLGVCKFVAIITCTTSSDLRRLKVLYFEPQGFL